MNKIENLLVIAIEECSEIQQELSKILRFGTDNYHPTDPNLSNGKRAMIEYTQLKIVMELLQDNNVLPVLNKSEEIQIENDKINAIKKWAEISENLGIIK